MFFLIILDGTRFVICCNTTSLCQSSLCPYCRSCGERLVGNRNVRAWRWHLTLVSRWHVALVNPNPYLI